MALTFDAVAFSVGDADAVAAFWAGLLGRSTLVEPSGVFLPGDATQVGLRFVTSDGAQVGRPRLHMHLTSSSAEDQRRIVETALGLGGRHLDVGQGSDASHVVLADPGGDEFCVIEPGEDYLAGTGRLGEVTCEGTRDAGMFWRDSLGWPLVWDEGAQVAIQSPLGGTKIAWDSWSGPPLDRAARSRQRFDLVTADLAGEAERLVSLGATRLSDLADGIALADPDGIEFWLRDAGASTR